MPPKDIIGGRMIIGLSGQKGSGKDTAAKFLAKKYNFEIRHFAAKLKDVCAKHFGLSAELLHNDPHYKNTPMRIEIKRQAVVRVLNEYKLLSKFYLLPEVFPVVNSPRELMQYIGTNILRKIDGNIHINTALSDAKDKNIVVADVRFLNEAMAIKELGGHVIAIKRGGDSANDLHESEMEVLQVREVADGLVLNNGSIEDFYAAIDKELKRILLNRGG